VIGYALSRKNKIVIGDVLAGDKIKLLELVKFKVQLNLGVRGSLLAKLVVQPVLRKRVLKAQKTNNKLEKIRREIALR